MSFHGNRVLQGMIGVGTSVKEVTFRDHMLPLYFIHYCVRKLKTVSSVDLVERLKAPSLFLISKGYKL